MNKEKKMKKIFSLMLVSVLIIGIIGCGSWTQKEKGAAVGTTAGGVLGGIIGKQAGNTAAGVILGAVIGGAAGAWIGSYMDKQAAEIEKDIAGAKVERIGEGIKITFDSGILFAVNKSDLTTVSKDNLAELARILNKYDDTNILLEGHTDATGTDEYNLELSKKRATAVASYLNSLQVNVARITTEGYGEMQPIADNETETGRAENRRVEVAIYANDELKKAAKNKTQG